ncbi:unnamed protein product [Cochlearia groenlandica]
MPLEKSEVSPIESTKKSKCLQRAKKIDKSLRFEEEKEEITKPLAQKEGLKPRKVVRFQLENNKIIEPKKDTKDEKPLEEEEVVRVKIRMTKQEARKLLLKCKNGNVLDYEHVVEYIAQGKGSLLSHSE